MCGCMFVWVLVYVHKFEHIHVEIRSQPQMSFFPQELSLAWSSLIRLDLLALNSRAPPVSASPVLGLHMHATMQSSLFLYLFLPPPFFPLYFFFVGE